MSTPKFSPDLIRQHKGVSFTGVGTVFFCHDGNGEFVMSRRSAQCRDEQGKWEIAGGGLDWGSTLEDNIRREVKEEFDATAKSVDYMGYREVFRQLDDGTPTHWLMFDFAVEVDPKEVKLNEPDKADEIGWFTLENQPSPVHSQHHVFIEKYYSKIRAILAS